MMAPHFSKFVDRRIGSFHHGLALIEASFSAKAWELLNSPESIDQLEGSPEDQFRLLLETNALAHERIHYVDTFGTQAGSSLVAARFHFLSQFIKVAIHMKKDGIRWQLPVSEWIDRPDVPPEVKSLANLALGHVQATKLFMAAIEPFMEEGHRKEAWLLLPFSTEDDAHAEVRYVPAYPQAIELRNLDGKPPARLVTVFHPLGYEAILEGRAHAMARSWVEARFPSYSSQTLANYGPPKTIAGPIAQDVAQRFEVYNMTDFMVSKFLRAREVAEFPRDLILQLSDLALSNSYVFVRQNEEGAAIVEMKNVGTAFVAEMVQLPATSTPTRSHSEQTTARYRYLLDSLLKGGDWDTVTGSYPYNSVSIWESFVAQHITVPLLHHRLNTDHAVYSDSLQLIKFVLSLDLPRVEVINEKLIFHHMPEKVRQAWAVQMFVGVIADQIFAGATTIRCPRAHKLLPGMQTIDFSNGECRKSIRRGCGSCTDGVISRTVECIFNDALSACRLTDTT